MSINWGAISWGFNAQDVLNNSVNAFATLAPYVLLGIAVMFVPRLIRLVWDAIDSRRYHYGGEVEGYTAYGPREFWEEDAGEWASYTDEEKRAEKWGYDKYGWDAELFDPEY